MPPAGVGLAIATSVVSGGGFLTLDSDTGLYAGVFELTLLGTVSVKAIGLINIKDAQGRQTFALLIVITAEGFMPIQLGFGFELTGIGGLLALNHTVDADAVKAGLRDGVLDQVLFVSDPVHNAAKIITTLERVFPQSPDRLLIGPLVEIGWGGSPPLVKIRMALLLELPKPVRVVLLAALSAYLPKPGAAVVELHVDAIGVLDLSRGELSLDASLHDSRILTYPLAGDMALLCNWGDAPILVLSCGGFHPRYQAPSRLRQLSRLLAHARLGHAVRAARGVPRDYLELDPVRRAPHPVRLDRRLRRERRRRVRRTRAVVAVLHRPRPAGLGEDHRRRRDALCRVDRRRALRPDAVARDRDREHLAALLVGRRAHRLHLRRVGRAGARGHR